MLVAIVSFDLIRIFNVFPSFLKHRVTPVTEGERISAVTWMHGTKFKRTNIVFALTNLVVKKAGALSTMYGVYLMAIKNTCVKTSRLTCHHLVKKKSVPMTGMYAAMAH